MKPPLAPNPNLMLNEHRFRGLKFRDAAVGLNEVGRVTGDNNNTNTNTCTNNHNNFIF